MNRRTFLCSTGMTAMGGLLPAAGAVTAAEAAGPEPFEWKTPDLTFSFDFSGDRLRLKTLMPAGYTRPNAGPAVSSGVETAIHCSGEDSPDPGMKQGMGQPGARLVFVDKKEEPVNKGRRLTITHSATVTKLRVESFYEAFDGVPVVRRWTRATNDGTANVGIEFLSSAMLHGLGDGQHFDSELKIHLAVNSWMAEAQWHAFRPSELGFVENERTSWSQASAGSIGSWSTEKYLPMAMVENTRLGLTWFWQIEHNGSWYWEISNVSARGNRANDVYAWLGGPDDLHSEAWKNLPPGASYRSVPVAVGCVAGGFAEAVAALTAYRRAACLLPHADNKRCSVIFNDYMNCLWGNPTEEKELPMIEAAAKAGCEYYVTDAGWYATLREDWSQTIGAWQPSQDRWPHGLAFVLDRVKTARNDPRPVARTRGSRRALAVGPAAGRLVSDAARQAGAEEFAVSARLSES